MDDLERQLHRYADQVEDAVGEVTMPTRDANEAVPPARRSLFLAIAAALLVLLGTYALVAGGDEGTSDVTDEPDVITGDDDPPSEEEVEPDPAPQPAPAPDADIAIDDEEPDPLVEPVERLGQFPAAPLAPRADSAVVPVADVVVVWGGSIESEQAAARGLAVASYDDGAVFDREASVWRTMAPSPFDTAGSFNPVPAVAIGAEVAVARSNEVAVYAPASDEWRLLPDLDFQPNELFELDDGWLVATAWPHEVAFIRPGDAGSSWARPQLPTAVENVAWVADGDRMLGVMPTTSNLFETGGVQVQAVGPNDAASAVLTRMDALEVTPGAFFDAVMLGGELVVVDEGGPIWTYDPTADEWRQGAASIGSSWESAVVAQATGDGTLLVHAPPRLHVGSVDELRSTVLPRSASAGAAFTEDVWWDFGLDASSAGDELAATAIPGMTSALDTVSFHYFTLPLESDETYAAWTVDSGVEVATIVSAVGSCDVVSYASGSVPQGLAPVGEIFDRVVHADCTGGGFVAAELLARIGVPTETGVVVPLVTDLFADTAITTLRREGLEVVTVFEEVPEGDPMVGRVIAQDPPGFASVEVGSVVTITIGESAWEPIPAGVAQAVVTDFLDALANGDYDRAAVALDNTAAVPEVLFDLGVREETWDTVPDVLASWCVEALCDAPYELGEIETDGFSATVEVVYFPGEADEFASGFALGWFEGVVFVTNLPPRVGS